MTVERWWPTQGLWWPGAFPERGSRILTPRPPLRSGELRMVFPTTKMDENAQLSPPSSPRRRGSSLRLSFPDWIPAFAGMTVERWWPTQGLWWPGAFSERGSRILTPRPPLRSGELRMVLPTTKMDENAQLSPPSSPRRRGSSLRLSFPDWIPAFAGMTVERWWPTQELWWPGAFPERGSRTGNFLRLLLPPLRNGEGGRGGEDP
jgi:hypothetical protein